jgi:DNA modification methylase
MSVPTPHYTATLVDLYLGDCIEVMAAMPEASVDAIVSDPPYGLEFMGKEWDRLGAGQINKPGIGDRETSWVSNRGWNEKRCRNCGHLNHGGSPCSCSMPDVRVDPSRWHSMQAWHEGWALAAFRVLKPGAHLLAFGGTRTHHRLMVALENAGFEIRDCLMWLYGSGFPKSLDVSKAIDKARDDRPDIEHVVRFLETARIKAGVSRKTVEDHFGTVNIGQAFFTITPGSAPRVPMWDQWLALKMLLHFGDEMDAEVWRLNGRKGQPSDEYASRPDANYPSAPGMRASWTAGRSWNGHASKGGHPVKLDADRWQGWGTALKPAWEPIILARKPLAEANVAANVLRYGTGGINVDGCRIETAENRARSPGRILGATFNLTNRIDLSASHPFGRWPANLVLDEEAARQLDAQSGESASAIRSPTGENIYGRNALNESRRLDTTHRGFSDTGGASRFFYTSKADKEDRDGATHPTVKPLDLMTWLIKLITPPQGLVLDPFAGSGSTIAAARDLGIRSIGIERESAYLDMAIYRLRQEVLGL